MCGSGGAALAAQRRGRRKWQMARDAPGSANAAPPQTDGHCTHGNATSALLFKSRLTD